MGEKILGREDFLKAIAEALKPLDYVYGMWQCGSSAFKRVDQWSDIDIVVDADDHKVRDVFPTIDKALEALTAIEISYECPQPMSEGAYQKVYKLEGISKFMVIEVCVVKHSGSEKFLQREIHGEVLVHFDKENLTEIKPIDEEKFYAQLNTRLENIDKLFNIYQFLIEKEINRDNRIEALAFYNNFTLNPLVEVLRMKYSPYRYSFRSRYVYYDLPKEVVKNLEDLYFITDIEDLSLKHKEAIRWFNITVAQLKADDRA